jgi:thioredoxin reductase (NADPH)
MSHYLVEQIAGIATIEVRTCTAVTDVGGKGHLERITLYDLASRAETVVPTGHLFVFIGAQPLTGWLEGAVARDEAGFVLAGADLLKGSGRPAGWTPSRDPWTLETSVPGVFAAGDVRSSSVKRVASAVGEGALAVTLVHQYLERL